MKQINVVKNPSDQGSLQSGRTARSGVDANQPRVANMLCPFGALSNRTRVWAFASCMVAGQFAALSQETPAPQPNGSTQNAPDLQSQVPSAPLPSAPEAAVEQYSTAATAQNEGAFEAAADYWAELLATYPAVNLSPKAEFYCGICNLELKRFDVAARHFQAVVTKWSRVSDQSDIEDAYLNLGSCYYSLARQQPDEEARLLDKAAGAFGDLLSRFGDGRYVDQALFFQGEAFYRRGKLPQATQAYARLVEAPDFRDSPLRSNAAYALGVAYEEQARFANAGQAYDLFLRDYPKHKLATEVLVRKAQTVMQRGLALQKTDATAEAAKLFSEAAGLFAKCAAEKNFANVDHALIQQARCYVELQRYAEAAQLYVQVATEFADSSYASSAVLNAGRALYRDGEYRDAQRWFQRVIRTNPENAAEASHWSCRVLLRNEQFDRAASLAERAVADAEDSEFHVALKMDLADALYGIPQQKPESVQLYLDIAQRHPKDSSAPQALYNAAYGALELQNLDDAQKYARLFQHDYAGHSLLSDVETILAECHLQKGEHQQAEAAFRELLARYSSEDDLHRWQVRLGLVLFLQQKYGECVQWLESILDQVEVPNALAEARHLVGASYFALEQYDPATENLQAALASAPRWEKADESMLILAQAFQKSDRLDDALRTAGELIDNFPKSQLLDEATYRYGEFWYDAQDYRSAALQYSAVMANWPQSPFAIYATFGLGWSRVKQNQFEKAIAPFHAIVKDDPQHVLAARSYLARGICRRQIGEYQLAVSDFEQFLAAEKSSPDRVEALYEKGLCEVELQDYQAAISSFSELLSDSPETAIADRALYEWAWAAKLSGDDDEASKVFRRLAVSHPHSPVASEACFHVGEEFFRAKEFKQAASHYEQAIEKLPSVEKSQQQDLRQKASYKLGWSRFQLGDFRTALAAFRDQTREQQTGELYGDGLFMVAECLFKLRQFEKALPAYEVAQTVAGDAPADVQVTILLHKGQSALELDRYEEAIQAFEEIAMRFPKTGFLSETYLELGRALHANQQLDEALEAFRKTAEKSFTVLGARARFMMGEILFSKKEHAAAIREFQRVVFGFQRAGADVSNWKAKSCYEAARCYEVQIASATEPLQKSKRIEDARKYYRYVVTKYPEHELAEPAQKRLAALDRL